MHIEKNIREIIRKIHIEDRRIRHFEAWLRRESIRISEVDKHVWREARKIVRIERELKRGARALLVVLKSMRRFSARLDWDFKRIDRAGRILEKVDVEFRGKGWSKEEEEIVKEVVEYKVGI